MAKLSDMMRGDMDRMPDGNMMLGKGMAPGKPMMPGKDMGMGMMGTGRLGKGRGLARPMPRPKPKPIAGGPPNVRFDGGPVPAPREPMPSKRQNPSIKKVLGG